MANYDVQIMNDDDWFEPIVIKEIEGSERQGPEPTKPSIKNVEDYLQTGVPASDLIMYYDLTTNTKTDLNRNGDVLRFMGLIIPKTIPFNQIESLQMITHTAIQEIPFNIIVDMCDMTIHNDNYYFKFKDGFLSYEQNLLPMIAMQYSIVGIQLNAKCTFKCKILVSYMILETDSRRRLAMCRSLTNKLDYKNLGIDNGKVIVDEYTAGIFLKTYHYPTELQITYKNVAVNASSNIDIIKTVDNCRVNKSLYNYGLHMLALNNIDKFDSIILSEKLELVRQWDIKTTVHQTLGKYLISDAINVILSYLGNSLHILWLPFCNSAKYTDYYNQYLNHCTELTLDFGRNFNATVFCNVHNIIVYENGLSRQILKFEKNKGS